MTPLELVAYYANLLILQYVGKPKAWSMVSSMVAPVIMPQVTVQQLSFTANPVSGDFIIKLSQFDNVTVNYDDSAATIQAAIQMISGYEEVTVTGSVGVTGLNFTFVGCVPPVPLLNISVNTLVDIASNDIDIVVTQLDQTLPLLTQDAFNLFGSNISEGVQLDVLGKYVGVARSYKSINLSDSDFLTVIQFAIVQNNSGSSLENIESNLNIVFPGQFIVADYQNMEMSFIFNSTLVNNNVLQVLIGEGLLPKPMGVGLTVIVIPVVESLFGFRTYDGPNMAVQPFNNYDDFSTSAYWLSYSNATIV